MSPLQVMLFAALSRTKPPPPIPRETARLEVMLFEARRTPPPFRLSGPVPAPSGPLAAPSTSLPLMLSVPPAIVVFPL